MKIIEFCNIADQFQCAFIARAITLVTRAYPIHRPTIPIKPAYTGGAGIGNLNALNTPPTISLDLMDRVHKDI